MKRWTSSSWISLIVIMLIPLSWVVQFLFNQMMLDHMLMSCGGDVLNMLNELQFFFISIPLGQLVTLATVVVPSIFIRKAARETSTNLTLPVGQNASTAKKPEITPKEEVPTV